MISSSLVYMYYMRCCIWFDFFLRLNAIIAYVCMALFVVVVVVLFVVFLPSMLVQMAEISKSTSFSVEQNHTNSIRFFLLRFVSFLLKTFRCNRLISICAGQKFPSTLLIDMCVCLMSILGMACAHMSWCCYNFTSHAKMQQNATAFIFESNNFFFLSLRFFSILYYCNKLFASFVSLYQKYLKTILYTTHSTIEITLPNLIKHSFV